MSSYSKKYISLKNDSSNIFLTWEAGYNNLKIYHEGKLIQTIESPGKLTAGLCFEDPNLGSVEVSLSTSSPMIIEIKIEGVRYYPESLKASVKKEAFSGVVSIFWAISILGAISAFIIQFRYNFRWDLPFVMIQLVFDIVIVSIYIIAAIFLSKRKVWAYFLGGITFFLMTLLYLYSSIILVNNIFSIIVFIVRVAMLIYIIRCYRDIILAQSSTKYETHELLDNNDQAELDF